MGCSLHWAAQDKQGKEAKQEHTLLKGQWRLWNKEDRDGQDNEPGLFYAVFPGAGQQHNKDGQQQRQPDQT